MSHGQYSRVEDKQPMALNHMDDGLIGLGSQTGEREVVAPPYEKSRRCRRRGEGDPSETAARQTDMPTFGRYYQEIVKHLQLWRENECSQRGNVIPN